MHNGEPIPPRMPPSPPPPLYIDPNTLRRGSDTGRRITLDDVPWDNSNSQYGLMGVGAIFILVGARR